MQSEEPGEFSIEESPQFTMNGAMFDVSQGNAVMRVSTIKNILKRMAVMGLNMLMVYTEDSYVVEGEPYFGYMRGRYTQEELRESDQFAALFGIEMIPCIQTLAHLPDVLKWPAYADMQDDPATLLVGNEKVYQFIERLITAASAPFRTKRIHIGMDEAWRLGLGAYLQQNGLRSKFDIMNEHLARVLKIVEQHGLQPMIWSDMYFRAADSAGGYYHSEDIPAEVVSAMPKNVELVYWDYYHEDEGFYKDYIKRHRSLTPHTIFAGGIWNWMSFAVNWGKTFRTSNAALKACKEEGVKEVFVTLWGDNGAECNVYTTLLGLQLFAEHGYARELDPVKLQKRFNFCTGGNYEDFMNVKFLDEVPGIEPDNMKTSNTSKYLMWQDLLTGLLDYNIAGLPLNKHYEELTDKLQAATNRNGEYNFLFDYLTKASHVLALKAEMGINLTEAYRSGDKEALRQFVKTDLPELSKRVTELRSVHRKLWFATYKAFGWDIMDMRYGSLLARIQSAMEEIEDYLAGNLERLEELEEERLSFSGRPGLVGYANYYDRIVSASRIAAHG